MTESHVLGPKGTITVIRVPFNDPKAETKAAFKLPTVSRWEQEGNFTVVHFIDGTGPWKVKIPFDRFTMIMGMS